jgi:ketose-bisphosphate aldolase
MQIDGKKLLKQAKSEKKAIPAFNVSSIEAVQAVMLAASELHVPVILETSEGEALHLLPEVLASVCKGINQVVDVDYVLHLDRAKDKDLIERCLKAGYNSIASEYGSLDYDENIRKTKEIRELTDRYDAQLEAALEVVPIRYYADKFQKELKITNPEMAKQYMDEVGADSFVISIGTQSGKMKVDEGIDMTTLIEINKLMTDTPLVLHGGSYMPEDVIKECIINGVSKINVNSENRMAYTKKLLENIKNNPDEYAPYRLLNGVKDEMINVVKSKINLFYLYN